MSGAIYAAVSGALLQQKRLELLANNLSNMNTVGFKQDRPSFRISDEEEDQTEVGRAASAPGNRQVLPPRLPFRALTDFSQGQIKLTGNPLDVALEGKGFFSVQTPDGVQYTRKGDMQLNAEGILVTQDGLPVLGEGGEIQIDGNSVTIDARGNISVDGSTADVLRVVSFPESTKLTKVGNDLYTVADAEEQGEPAESAQVVQGAVENSNVEAVQMMTEMIETLRGFESYQKVMQSLNDITMKAINEVGRL